MNQIPHDEWTEKIIARVNGELDAVESTLLDSHVQICPQCRRELREYELLSRRLHALERNVVAPALSPALLALKQEIAQGAQSRLFEDVQEILNQAFLSETEDSSFKERPQRGRETVIVETQGDLASTPDSETQILVRRAKEGDGAAFEVLFQRYEQAVYRYLCHIVGNVEDARDLTMETFLRAWRELPQMHDGRHFQGWLYRIAHSMALDYIKVSQRLKRPPPLAGSLDKGNPDELVAQFEDRLGDQELIQLALEQVSPKERACLTLLIEGWSLAEIANLLGMSESSVRVYISRAREQLRKAYYQLRKP